MKKLGLSIVGVVIGFPIGAILGVVAMQIAGRLVFGMDFFQISWVFVPFVFVITGVVSASIGVKLATAKPKLFVRTFVPAFVVLTVWGIIDYTLRRIERPRRYTVAVTPEGNISGAPLANNRTIQGVILVDHVSNSVEGVLPVSFSFTGTKLDYRLELIDGVKDECFTVTISVDGNRERPVAYVGFPATGTVETRGIGWWAKTFHGMSKQNPKVWK